MSQNHLALQGHRLTHMKNQIQSVWHSNTLDTSDETFPYLSK